MGYNGHPPAWMQKPTPPPPPPPAVRRIPKPPEKKPDPNELPVGDVAGIALLYALL